MTKQDILERLLKLADDLDYGLRPSIASQQLRELVQHVQPGTCTTPANPNDAAHQNAVDTRLSNLEREMTATRSALTALRVYMGKAILTLDPSNL